MAHSCIPRECYSLDLLDEAITLGADTDRVEMLKVEITQVLNAAIAFEATELADAKVQ
jgi:hypothetical protein